MRYGTSPTGAQSVRCSSTSTGRGEVRGHRGPGHHTAAERFGFADPSGVQIIGRDERLSLECARRGAQFVLHEADGVVELLGTLLAPQSHLGQPVIERCKYALTHSLIAGEE